MLDWDRYTEIAKRFERKVLYPDREDVRHDIILRLAEVQTKRNDDQLTEVGMIRTASYVIYEYWTTIKRKPNILSLNSTNGVEDGQGRELWETLADDNAIDPDAWLDANVWLLGCPGRLVQLAQKRVDGFPLEVAERKYLSRFRTRAKQLQLV